MAPHDLPTVTHAFGTLTVAAAVLMTITKMACATPNMTFWSNPTPKTRMNNGKNIDFGTLTKKYTKGPKKFLNKTCFAIKKPVIIPNGMLMAAAKKGSV